MNEKLIEELKNVPYDEGGDAFESLRQLTDIIADVNRISKEERKRLNYELKLIKKWGVAKLFLFGIDACLDDEGFGKALGIENYSYVNYLLGFGVVNPVTYALPFERFFNEHRKALPRYITYLPKGRKGFLLKSLYGQFGKSTIMRARDDETEYFISNKPINSRLIEESVIVAKLNEETYEENVSILTSKELRKLGYYSFIIIEVNKMVCSEKDKFSEKEIYEKAKELFADTRPDIDKFTEIDGVKEILVNTEYKLIFQEQLMEILHKICGFSIAKSDLFRREIIKRNSAKIKQLKKLLIGKYNESGKRLLEYLCKNGLYTISKAYVIARLQNEIE